VFVSSTYNVGKLNDKFVTLVKKLLKDEKLSLKDKKIALVALGDSAHYDIFAGAADELEELVEKIEAEKIGSSLKIDGSPFKSVQKIKDWSRKLV
jgi:flavodoxin